MSKRYSYLQKNKERNPRDTAVIVRIASGITLILLALTLYAVLQSGLAVLPQIVFLVAVVVGMWWRNPWSGYGAAFVMAASVTNVILASVRDRPSSTPAAGLALISILLAGMYWRAGQAMGSVRPWTRGTPWLVFAGLLFAFPFFFRACYVPSGGMEPTVLQGDSVMMLRRLGRTPVRGNIVVHRYPLETRQLFIKRVVATGGDRVAIRDKKLYVNGSAVNEPWAVHTTPQTVPLRDNFPEVPDFPLVSPEWAKLMDASSGKDVTVPPGKLFVLGDNRDSSLDSRYWGFIDPEDVLGTPLFIYWSVDKRAMKGDPDIPLSKVRWARVFHML